MKLTVKVKPNASRTLVEKLDELEYVVSVTVPPADGKANDAVIRALADHFGVAKSRVRIAAGHTARTKIIEVS